MSLIEHWTCSRCGADHAGFTVCQSCGTPREVATGESDVERLTRQLRGAVGERDALREAVRAYLNGAPLDEHGRFRDPAREVLYRAAGGQ